MHVNSERAKPARPVKLNDKLIIVREQERTELFVRTLSDTRRSAALAKLLYDETAESILGKQTLAERRKFYAEPANGIVGRPTKRDRRALSEWRESE